VRAPWEHTAPRSTVKHRSSDGTSVRGPDHVITDWPSDHMQSSKHDAVKAIISLSLWLHSSGH
ncbi:unnamed protein product, partial [Staurois parvus]